MLYDKLAAVGLVPNCAVAEQTTLAAFLDDYLAKRSDIKPGTRINLTLVPTILLLSSVPTSRCPT